MKFNYKALVIILMLLSQFESVLGQSNLQTYTPSVLLQKGQFEFNQYNSLYSQTKIRDRNGNKIDLGGRQSFLRNTFSVLFGISENKRINVGFEAAVVTGKYSLTNNSIFSFFSKETGDQKETFLSSFGPKIKFTPFKKISFLSVQSTLFFPLSNGLENPRFIDHNRISWITQVFFDKAISNQFRIFLEAGVLYRFKKLEAHRDFFRVPLSAILSYFPSSNITVFGSIQHSPAFGTESNDFSSKFGQLRWFTAAGLGVKYQATDKLGLEVSFSNFILSRNEGAGSTINLGIRIIN